MTALYTFIILSAMTHFVIFSKQIANRTGSEFSLSKNCAIVHINEKLKYTTRFKT